MERGGGGCDEPSLCSGELLSPYISSAGSGWPDAEPSHCVGGNYVLSRAPDATDGPRYLFDHIPPRLAPSRGEDDLFDLPAAGGEDDLWPPTSEDRLCRPAPERLGAAPVSCAAAVTQPGPPSVSVSIGGCSRLEPASVPTATERRPLHHSGGGLCRTSEPPQPAADPEGCIPAIEIGLRPSCPSSCSGSIKLQISVPCNRATTVSVRSHPPHGAHTAHVPHAAHLASHAASCGPCAAPASPLPASPCRPPHPLRSCCGPSFGPIAVAVDATPPEAAGDDEMAVLAKATAYLRESGWYYGMLSWQEAQEYLRGANRGTFLARDSFDRRFLFALTVQTAKGPTSVRVQFLQGRFRLDAPATLLPGMPTFPDVNSLVEHYARHGHVLYDQKGRPLLKMRLVRPLRQEPPSLQHWCRLALNAAGLEKPPLLPDKLQKYVQEYPFSR
ncbi:Cytokine-inducible SH2-containing protein [Amphibalanus amphitrite]|uniref:Cytokine-inducible SH2-containing protein n=1 Tax=Amphibalanus amphitrite TaxID=1232801 RepID=A0A6A4WF94_AMPAM|nr:Cytokine-inducible SH2-containing protein [Amphibalanus amphitrite]